MLNEAEKQTQADIQIAYGWIMQVTAQVDVLLEDAGRFMQPHGLEDLDGLKSAWGMKLRSPENPPFVSWVARRFGLAAPGEAACDAFLGVRLHNPRRDVGPALLAGAVRPAGVDSRSAYWALFWATYDDVYYAQRFTAEGSGIRTSVPTERAREAKGVGSVQWFELPLAWVSTPVRLQQIVDAAVALRDGDEKPARALLAEVE